MLMYYGKLFAGHQTVSKLIMTSFYAIPLNKPTALKRIQNCKAL